MKQWNSIYQHCNISWNHWINSILLLCRYWSRRCQGVPEMVIGKARRRKQGIGEKAWMSIVLHSTIGRVNIL